MLRRFHRLSALVIVLFAVPHLVNHLIAIQGVQAHMDFMDSARLVYRWPPLEGLLLICVLFQVVSGLRLLWRGWHQRVGRLAWLQAGSGAYLALFLCIHVGAVLSGRAALGLETNFYFAAAGMHVGWYALFFVPYYGLAVVALFAHLGCALYWMLESKAEPVRRGVVYSSMIAGVVVAALILLALGGAFSAIEIPAQYRASYPG